ASPARSCGATCTAHEVRCSIAACLPRRRTTVGGEFPVLDRVLVVVDVPVGYRALAAVASLYEREIPGLRERSEYANKLQRPVCLCGRRHHRTGVPRVAEFAIVIELPFSDDIFQLSVAAAHRRFAIEHTGSKNTPTGRRLSGRAGITGLLNGRRCSG